MHDLKTILKIHEVLKMFLKNPHIWKALNNIFKISEFLTNIL